LALKHEDLAVYESSPGHCADEVSTKVARRQDLPWICCQNWICPWSLINILLSLSIFRRP